MHICFISVSTRRSEYN